MASFDRAIPPGGVGKITLSVSTEGYQGSISKTARVYSNDPKNEQATLTLMASVKVPIHLNPTSVYFRGKEGERITRTVTIKAGLDKPLILTPDTFNLAEKLDYRLEKIEEGRRFMIHFTSHAAPPQTYQGFLKLKTNYSEKPMVSINITGIIVDEKESPRLPPSPEFTSHEVQLPGPPSSEPPPEGPLKPMVDPNVPPPPGAESLEPMVDPNVPPPPGAESLEPVVDPNEPPPPGAESLEPVVDPNLPPPPGAEPLKATPSLEPDAKNAVPSDTEEENAPKQPK